MEIVSHVRIKRSKVGSRNSPNFAGRYYGGTAGPPVPLGLAGAPVVGDALHRPPGAGQAPRPQQQLGAVVLLVQLPRPDEVLPPAVVELAGGQRQVPGLAHLEEGG